MLLPASKVSAANELAASILPPLKIEAVANAFDPIILPVRLLIAPVISVAICTELLSKPLLFNIVVIDDPVAASIAPLMSVAIWADAVTNAGNAVKLLNGIDPDTIWPPLATTALPVVADPKWISTTSAVLVNIAEV